MTEVEWFDCLNPGKLLRCLDNKWPHLITERKLRLFLCACYRRHVSTSIIKIAIEIVENHVDGRASRLDYDQATYFLGGRSTTQDLEHVETCFKAGEAWPFQNPAMIRESLRWDHLDNLAKAELAALHMPASIAKFKGEMREEQALELGLTEHQAYEFYDLAFKEERNSQTSIFRDIFGNPFRPVASLPLLLTSRTLAQATYDDRILPSGTLDPVRLASLADDLQQIGCEDANLLAHLRAPGPHYRGCFALDLIMGKEG